MKTLTIKKDGNTIYCNPDFSDKDAVKAAGFWWDGARKRWFLPEKVNATNCIERLGSEFNLKFDFPFDREQTQVQPNTQCNNEAIKYDKSILENLSVKLFTHQLEAIEFISSKKNILLGDEMGLGKTLSVLSFLKSSNRKATIVCPKSVIYSWKNEAEKIGLTAQIYKPKFLKRDEKVFNKEAQVKICGYESVEKCAMMHPEILEIDTVVLDESHYIKSYDSKRTENIKYYFQKIDQKILLSGTALKNKTKDLYSQLSFIRPFEFNSFIKFAERYCNSHKTAYGWNNDGSSNQEELREKMSVFTLRRLKSDVLNLPKKIESEIKCEFKESDYDVEDALQCVFLSKKYTAEQKIDETILLLETMKESNEKVVVFTDFVSVKEEIFNKFSECSIILNSEDSPEKRAEKVKKFQENENILFFISTMPLAKEGVTLTAASKVIFNDLPWTYADKQQAEDRLHRISQVETVNVYSVISESIFDTYLTKLVEAKKINQQITLDGKLSDEEIEKKTKAEFLKELQEEINKKKQKVA